MNPDDLCAAVRAALDETEQWTRAARAETLRERAAGRLNLTDRASVIRRVAADRRVLERHVPRVGMCEYCDRYDRRMEWPCPDFRDLMDRSGITTEETT